MSSSARLLVLLLWGLASLLGGASPVRAVPLQTEQRSPGPVAAAGARPELVDGEVAARRVVEAGRARQIGREDQLRLVERAVSEWASSQPALRITGLRLRNARPFTLPAAAGEPGLALDDRALSRGGRLLADLAYTDATGVLRHRWLQVELTLARRAVRLTRGVASGETLAAADLAEVELPLTQLAADAVDRLDDGIGMVARQALPAGRLLVRSAIDAPLLVRRDEEVRIIAERGALQLATTGRALAAGARDARVTVRLAGNGQIVEGLVRAAGVVEVGF